MAVYVRLERTKVIQGQQKHKGDWVKVGSDTAQKWIADGSAQTLDYAGIFEEKDCAAIHLPSPTKARLPFQSIEIHEGELIPYKPRNLLIDQPYSFIHKGCPDVLKNAGRLAMAFRLLEKWDVVLFLAHYETTAFQVAHNEHDATREIVKDLRVLYYADSVIGVRDSKAGREFCSAWAEEKAKGRVLAPLRALWRIKPMAYFLPPDWL